LEFYEDESGDQPVRRWLSDELTDEQRYVLGFALYEHLQHLGLGVCEIGYGKQLGGGLFEFRLRSGPWSFRVFCHAYGGRLILLLAGYDKARSPSKRRQLREIALARARLKEFRQRVLGQE
jgi:putative component of toxin-antitoxin plasmid stabilization module